VEATIPSLIRRTPYLFRKRFRIKIETQYCLHEGATHEEHQHADLYAKRALVRGVYADIRPMVERLRHALLAERNREKAIAILGELSKEIEAG
jgi:hypothetical protein